MSNDESFAHGILGDKDCPHETVWYYYSGFQDMIWSVCQSCHWHVWNVQPPADVEVINIDAIDDEPDFEDDEEIVAKAREGTDG